ncbi:hypothetical protein B0H63DRAFT_27607 [Podospora didyma]|uniref:Uncharacterized protein n=1 Tax=Podospora didyma TaxID=330526 RepID=A0AAE0P5E9_9PEZI|nr:hypothetical protein B0H63DRAFT_27607 [Podospora didyma]
MDLRGYGLPIHPGYAPYPRERYRSEELDVWNPYKPPFPPPEYRDMSPSTSRGPSPSSSSSTDDRSVKAKLAQFSPKPQNPGIDLALRNLSQEVVSSLKMYQSLVLGFDAQTELISDWADGSTLDTVWRNKIKDKFRDKRERERFEGVAGRIANCKKYLKESIRSGLSIKATSDTQYKVEQQIRTAKKALIYCECIIDLSQRAANERRACRDLVRELEELKDLLNQRKNSWICKISLLSRSQDMPPRD